MEFLGYKLKELREAKGLKMKDIEDITGVHQSIISELETGKKKTPRKATVDRLAKGLKVDEQYFYFDNWELPESILPDMPEEVKKFIMSGENVPYLVTTEKLKREGAPPELIEKLYELYKMTKK